VVAIAAVVGTARAYRGSASQTVCERGDSNSHGLSATRS
jgi:hypothetical protein